MALLCGVLSFLMANGGGILCNNGLEKNYIVHSAHNQVKINLLSWLLIT